MERLYHSFKQTSCLDLEFLTLAHYSIVPNVLMNVFSISRHRNHEIWNLKKDNSIIQVFSCLSWNKQ